MMFPVNVLLDLAAADYSWLKESPLSMFVILAISLALGLVMSLLSRRSMDLKAYRRMMIESQRVRQEMMAATRSGNQRRIDKAQRRQQQLMAEQSKMSMSRMKSTMFFTLPLILFWPTLSGFFKGLTVAYFPFDAPWIPREMAFGHWYFLCAISLNIVVSRVLGLTFEIDPDDKVEE